MCRPKHSGIQLVLPTNCWVTSTTYTGFFGTVSHVDGGIITSVQWKLGAGGTYADVDTLSGENWSVASIALADGPNILYVQATDSAGDTLERAVSISVDSDIPVVSLGADQYHNGTGQSVPLTAAMFTENHPATVRYRIDSGSWVTWPSPYPDTTVSVPSAATDHTIELDVVDRVGRQAADTMTVLYAAAPNVSITPTSGWVASAMYTEFAGMVSPTGAATITAVEYQVGSGAWTSVDAWDQSSWSQSSITLAEGDNILRVRATDNHGETDISTITISVDTINPTVNLGADGAHNGTGATFVLMDTLFTEANPVTVEYRLDSGAWQSWAAPYTNVNVSIPADQVNHTVSLRVTDRVGRQATDTVSLLYADVPTVTITSATGWMASSSYTFSGTVAPTGAATISAVEYRLDSGGWAPVDTHDQASWSHGFTGLTQGNHTLAVRATDSNGATVDASITMTVDTVAPVVALGADTTHDGSGVTFVVMDTMVTETNPASVEWRIDGGAWNQVPGGDQASWANVDITVPADTANHTIEVRATDQAGNQASNQVSISYDKPQNDAFIFEVITSGTATFQLPLESAGTYDFHVDWGDGTSSDITQFNHADTNHGYGAAGTYIVRITGTIRGFNFSATGIDKELIGDISAWGPLALIGSSGNFFFGCSNLTMSATDAPDLTDCTSLLNAFRSTALTQFHANTWDTSTITNIRQVMQGCHHTIQSVEVDQWDVSQVTIARTFMEGAMTTPQYDALILSWSPQVQNVSALFGAGVSKYTSGGDVEAARNAWIAKGWTITDGGPA